MNRAALAFMVLVLSLSASVALAETVAVVSADNPVSTLSRDQVVDIFLGKRNYFPDGRPAEPIDQAEGSDTRDVFYLEVTGKSPAQVKAHWSKIIFTGRGQPPREAANSAEVKQYVAGNPNAIGYIDRKMMDGSVKAVLGQ